jgi:predicted enzyme related to lactoylglutathione lyase
VQIDVLFASVPVADLATATAWYEALFGRGPDIVPNEHEVMWRIADGAWLYVITDPDRAGHTSITMSVADLDATVTGIEQRGLTITSREAVGEAGRKAWLRDPDGNAVAIIEVFAHVDD